MSLQRPWVEDFPEHTKTRETEILFKAGGSLKDPNETNEKNETNETMGVLLEAPDWVGMFNPR